VAGGGGVDPFSVAALGGAALVQGIGFLYSQAGELLRRRRDRKQSPAAAAEPMAIPSADAEKQPLAGQLTAGPVDEQALDQHASQLAKLWGLLAPYATGLAEVDPADRQLVEQAEAARALIEQIYGQHITFTGEQRPATGTLLSAQHSGDTEQYVARVIASGERAVAAGRDITGTVTTGDQGVPGDHRPVSRPPSA
jgi:hypothetical protein